MVGLVAKPNFKVAKFLSFNLVMVSFFFFYLEKKIVRSFSSLSGRQSALSGRLKLESFVMGLNLGNFTNLMSSWTTNSHILNKTGPSKRRKTKS